MGGTRTPKDRDEIYSQTKVIVYHESIKRELKRRKRVQGLHVSEVMIVVYYETKKWELNKRLIHECRCDERLKAKAERSARLTYVVLCGGQEHLKIKTRLIDETFTSGWRHVSTLFSRSCQVFVFNVLDRWCQYSLFLGRSHTLIWCVVFFFLAVFSCLTSDC